MTRSTSSSSRLDPDGARRDYLCARRLIDGDLVEIESIRAIYAGMSDEMAGRLAGRLVAAGILDAAIKEKLDRKINRQMREPLGDLDIRGIDRIFRRAVRSKGAVDLERLARAVARQKKQDPYEPLWVLLPAKGMMEEVLARILESRCRARFFRRQLVELLGGAHSLRGNDAIGPGRQLGNYRLDREVARDRLGIVFAAVPLKPGSREQVALRILPAIAGSRLTRCREALESVASLRHKGIAGILEVSYENDVFFVVTELLDADPLDQYVQEENVTIEERLALVRDAARAVDFAHRRGVLHRDLRPSSILVDGDARVHVADFGLFHMIGMEDDVETLPYRSPEELGAHGGQPSDRSDVYTLGIVAYELLTGLLPVDGEDVGRISRRIQEMEGPDPGGRLEAIEPNLAEILRKAIHPFPTERTESASALAHELARYLSPGSRMDLGPTEARPVAEERRMGVGVLVAGILFLVALVGAAVAVLWPGDEAGGGGEVEQVAEDPDDLLRRGRARHDAGSPGEALPLLERAAVLAPTRADIQLALGRAQQDIGRVHEARLAFERAVEIDPDHDEAWFLLGERLYFDGEYRRSIESLDRFLTGAPESSVARRMRGQARLVTGDRQGASADLDRVSVERPDDVLSHVLSSALALLAGRATPFRAALARLEAAVARSPGKDSVVAAALIRVGNDSILRHLSLGIYLDAVGEGAAAAEAFSRMGSKTPDQLEFHVEFVDYLLADPARASSLAQAGRSLYLAAVYWSRRHQADRAIDCLEKARLAIDLEPLLELVGKDADAYYCAGIYNYQLISPVFPAAEERLRVQLYLQKCLDLDPGYWQKQRAERILKGLRQ